MGKRGLRLCCVQKRHILRQKYDKNEVFMQQLIILIMNQCGYLGVCLLIAVENLFPPIPSEVILTFAGFMTTYTRLTVLGVVIFATIGSTIGAIILYAVGSALTPEKLEQLVETKWFRWLGFRVENVQKTMKWFREHGTKAVFLGRCIPIIRSLISVPAGMAQMQYARFLFYTIAGSTLWNILLVNAGAILGESWELVVAYINRYSMFVKTILFAGGVCLFVRYIKSKLKRKTT